MIGGHRATQPEAISTPILEPRSLVLSIVYGFGISAKKTATAKFTVTAPGEIQ